MEEVIRHDRIEFKAEVNAEGFLVDNPVIARTGILEYRNPDGTVRRELVLPEELFSQDSMDALRGIPITLLHPQEVDVTVNNADRLVVGSIVGSGFADPDGVRLRAPVSVYRKDAVNAVTTKRVKQVSLGYKVRLERTPGVWNGMPYDAIQRNRKPNHMAIVPLGRAEIAQFNLDAGDAVSNDFFREDVMPQSHDGNLSSVRIDGLEYKASPEVVRHIDKLEEAKTSLQAEVSKHSARADAAEAERDVLKSEAAQIDKIRADAKAEGRAEAKARLELEAVASEVGVNCDSKTDREVKVEFIKAVRTDSAIDLESKTDAYLDAAFDLCVESRRSKGIEAQRQAVTGSTNLDVKDDILPSEKARLDFMSNIGWQGDKYSTGDK